MTALVDVEAERAVLGACVAYPGRLADVAPLATADFGSPESQVVIAALRELDRRGESIGELQLIAELTRTSALARAGGHAGVLALTDRIQSRDQPLPIEAVKALSRRRRVRSAALATVAACDSGDSAALASALADAQVASQDGTARSAAVDAYDAYCELALSIEIDERRDLVTFGMPKMAALLGPIPVPSSVGILATTSVGKSTYTLEALVGSVLHCGLTCGYVSVEDQLPRVTARIAAMITQIHSRDILSGRLNPEQKQTFRAGCEAARQALHTRLFLDCMPGGTDFSVLAAMTGLAAKGCRVIAVDYLQKIRGNAARPRAQEVSDIASAITSHGQRLGVITLLVSQTARNKDRENKCPSKHDMKESGDIENMLDVIIALWREDESDSAPMHSRAIKTKDGGLGATVSLRRVSGRLVEVEPEVAGPSTSAGRRSW